MGQERITELPQASNANLTDIIVAVQGYNPPTTIGTSVRESLQQVFNLFNTNIIIDNLGNPNGVVAGSLNQLCWDSVNHILYICTAPGTSSTAVWTKTIELTAGTGVSISQAGSTITISAIAALLPWTIVVGTTQIMSSNNGYIAANAGQVTLVLPAGSSVGDEISIVGQGAGGWKIDQNAGQLIRIGSAATSTGVGGSVSSTNRYDSMQMVCTVANFEWTVLGAPQSLGLTIV